MARKKLEIAPADLSRTVAAELCLESERLAKVEWASREAKSPGSDE